jgi:adenosylcobinamide-GDP ribazoletransferase
MTSPARALRAAFVFLTRVPVGGFPYVPDEWRWASACFPLVGAAVGGLTALAFVALQPLGAPAAAIFAIAASLLVTGAFHEDGLADTADALGGAFDRAKVFAILKDSRVGTFGACALVVSLAGRSALLVHAGADRAWSFVFVAAAARAASVWLLALLPYATPEGAKSRDVSRGGPAQAAVGSGIALGVGAALVGVGRLDALRASVVVALCAGVTLLAGRRFLARAGGVTGDFLGANEQLCEVAGLAAIAWGAS